MSIVLKSEKLCKELHNTYNARILKLYPHKLQQIVFSITEKNKNKGGKRNTRSIVNHTLISLINNLNYPHKQPVTQYITGPSNIEKWTGNKTIYLFGENSHSSYPTCNEQIDTYGKGTDFHMNITSYLLQLFKTSPVFIDFYVEFGVMLNEVEFTRLGTGQTLHDMLYYMKGCFGKLLDRNCPYNVRMHGVDARTVIGKKAIRYREKIYELVVDMQMYLYMKKKGGVRIKKDGTFSRIWIDVKTFKEKYKILIKKLSQINTINDIHNMVEEIINNNLLLEKEIRKSSLSKKKIVDFFINREMIKTLRNIRYGAKFLGIWFKSLIINKEFPKGMEVVHSVLTVVTASLMDVYASARIFKTFNINPNKYQHYPTSPQNIIYYAGDGHIKPMSNFLKHLGFIKKEVEDSKMISCVSMNNIKQPLFS